MGLLKRRARKRLQRVLDAAVKTGAMTTAEADVWRDKTGSFSIAMFLEIIMAIFAMIQEFRAESDAGDVAATAAK